MRLFFTQVMIMMIPNHLEVCYNQTCIYYTHLSLLYICEVQNYCKTLIFAISSLTTLPQLINFMFTDEPT